MDILGIDSVRLAVGDLDAAVVHYGGALGLPLRLRQDEAGTAVFSAGPDTRGIIVRIGTPGGSGFVTRVWLEVADARAAGEEVRSRGASHVSAPIQTDTGWIVEVADPWGNVAGLTDYSRRPELRRPGPRSQDAPAASESEHPHPPAIPEALLTEALETLSTREQEMLRYRFGLKDGAPHTLDETGRAFRVTRERVRQVETKLIRQLQQPE